LFDRLRGETRFRELMERIDRDLRQAEAVVAQQQVKAKMNRGQ
jgi:hypothetical protein